MLARTAAAQIPLPVHIVPLALRHGERGPTPRSELTVTNLGAATATVGVAFFPEGRAGAFASTFPLTLATAPGHALRVEDVLSRCGVTGTARGWLLVADATAVDCASRERPYPALLHVTSRIAGPRGGCDVPLDWTSLNVTQLPSIIVVPPRQAGGAELDVGAANISLQAITVRVTVRSPQGRALATADRLVAAQSLGMWRMTDLGLRVPAEGGRVDVALADDGDAWNPCRTGASPPPCVEPCDRTACPQRYQFPGFPAFFAFGLMKGPGSELRYLRAVVDQVGGLRYGTAYRQRHCPDQGGFARLVDLFSRLALLRDPMSLQREPIPPRP
jgi:hypothetical protein